MMLHGQAQRLLAQGGMATAAPRLCTRQRVRGPNRVGVVGVLARPDLHTDSPPQHEESHQAAEPPTSGGWWTKNNPANMRDVTSIQHLVDELADAGDKLVIVEFYAPWCNACKALFPKLCRIMAEHEDDVLFLKVSFESNKDMCKTMGVKVLPLFHFYRGAQGRVDQFSCTISKLQRFKDALENYSSAFCSLEEFPGVEEFPDVHPHHHDTPTQLHLHPHAWDE